MALADPEQTVRAYYRAHADGDTDGVCDRLTEDLLQRVLVEELGGDTCDQAVLEGHLMHPDDRYDDAADLARAEYEVEAQEGRAHVLVPQFGVGFRLDLVQGSWQIAAFE